jgi:hypothetical protein
MTSYESRVRARKSYRRFERLSTFLEAKPEVEAVLYRVHCLIDQYGGFRSRRASEYAREAIDLLVRDRGGGQPTP